MATNKKNHHCKFTSKKIVLPIWIVTTFLYIIVAVLGFIFNLPRLIANSIFFTMFFKVFGEILKTTITIRMPKQK